MLFDLYIYFFQIWDLKHTHNLCRLLAYNVFWLSHICKIYNTHIAWSCIGILFYTGVKSLRFLGMFTQGEVRRIYLQLPSTSVHLQVCHRSDYEAISSPLKCWLKYCALANNFIDSVSRDVFYYHLGQSLVLESASAPEFDMVYYFVSYAHLVCWVDSMSCWPFLAVGNFGRSNFESHVFVQITSGITNISFKFIRTSS